MSNCKHSKVQLRGQLRQRRQALSRREQLAAANAVAANITQLPCWPDAGRIALYLPQDGEIDTMPLTELCRSRGMELFLPVIDSDDCLSFALWQVNTTLCANRYGIDEPPAGSRLCPAAELDILALPLVGWDRKGGRLGMGGGFYDRTLSGITAPQLVGLAHALQELEHVPRDQWDIPLDYVVTEAAVHNCVAAR